VTPLAQALIDYTVSPTSAEGSMIDQTNQSRALAGLNPLSFDNDMLTVARQRAQQQGIAPLDHFGPNGQLMFFQMLQAAGLSPAVAGENLARSTPWDASAVEQGLMASPTHRANILNPAWSRFAAGTYAPNSQSTNLAELFR
jgi:uncharacterized protein YkwD